MPSAAGEAVPQQHDQVPAAEARASPQETQQVRVQEAQHLLPVIYTRL